MRSPPVYWSEVLPIELAAISPPLLPVDVIQFVSPRSLERFDPLILHGLPSDI